MRPFLLLALIVACGGERSSPAPSPTSTPPPVTAPARGATVRVDRRVELVSIVQRLAGGAEYNRAPASSPYVAGVDAWFEPFKHHAAVADAIQDRKQFGVSNDAPMVLAVHLDDRLELRNAAEIPQLDARLGKLDLAQRAANLRAFAAEAKLDEFLASQRAHLTTVETELRAVIEAENAVSWFDGVFGPAPATFFVVPGLLTGTMNYGPRVTLPDGTQELYQVLAVTGRDGRIERNDQLVRLLVHEMAHSYINPVFGAHRAVFEPAAAKVLALVGTEMAAQAYRDPLTMVNESGVRALVVMYMHERKGAEAGAAALRAELRASFLWTPAFVEVMRRFQRGGTRDLPAFMPEVTAFWDQLAADYARTGLPARTFLGPLDDIYTRAPIWIEPADSAELATYVRALQQQLSPQGVRVTASAKVLAEHPGQDLVAYGTPATNPAIAAVAAEAGWTIGPDMIKLGGRTFTGPGLVLVACWPRPDDRTRGVALYAASDARSLVGVNHKLRHGERDWLVARARDGAYELLATGDFPRAADGTWMPPTR